MKRSKIRVTTSYGGEQPQVETTLPTNYKLLKTALTDHTHGPRQRTTEPLPEKNNSNGKAGSLLHLQTDPVKLKENILFFTPPHN